MQALLPLFLTLACGPAVESVPPPQPTVASDGTKLPPGGCEKDGIIFDKGGSAWGCVGGGNWCANTPAQPGVCDGAR